MGSLNPSRMTKHQRPALASTMVLPFYFFLLWYVTDYSLINIMSTLLITCWLIVVRFSLCAGVGWLPGTAARCVFIS